MEHCDRFLALISQALDEELPLEDQRALADHLAQCPQCRELKRQLEEIQDELGSWEEQEVPDGFAQDVMDRIRALPPSNILPFWKRPQVRVLGSLAACVLICVGVLHSGLGQPYDSAAVDSGELVSSDITADSRSAVDSPALKESRDESGPDSSSDSDSLYYTVASGASPAGASSYPGEPAAQSELFASTGSGSDGTAAHQFSASSGGDTSASSQLQTYSMKSRCAAAPEPDGQALLQSVTDTLGETPGTLLVISEIPSQCQDSGQWYSTDEGYSVLVLEKAPDDDLYQTLIQDSLLCLEVGEGAFALLFWPQ